jgi:uracil-DNA glycosylase
MRSAGGPASWQLGEAQLLYADTAVAQGPRWLVLAESGAATLQDPPFQGDAGKLLDNMLRAARLQQAGAVLLAPLARQAAGGSAGADFSAELAALLKQAQPDVVLVMGRLAAQALLQSSLPFNKLRGQVHRLHGSATVVTYDAPYLLRSPADKAKAWADLCLAMSLTRPA